VNDDLAISVTGLTKVYRIRHRRPDSPTRATEAIVQRLRHPIRRDPVESFEALSDVTFDVPVGEAVGIVGRNGAGKSTLLKLLTRVTAPSAGVIELRGRVGSLLEVGTGFHPELTGRENIFLNGTLLGMRAKEIRRQFDEIVDFSGVEKFLDTPVKRYSSGMYVRLAFAVAAHLEAEILAIDEVLSVGDTEFQARSIAKMRDVAADGRTVLYVSHQLPTVSALCTSAMYLESGRLRFYGDVPTALDHYRQGFDDFALIQQEAGRRPGTGELRATSVTVSGSGTPADAVRTVEIELPESEQVTSPYFVSVHVNDADGIVVAQCDSRLQQVWCDPVHKHLVTITIRGPWLKPGRYTVDVFVCQAGVLDAWEGAGAFEVLPIVPYPMSDGGEAIAAGVVLADFDVKAEQL
jgi:lipopolysaccharide transport system ATP-binding protein